jgi:hypothetical protein
LIGGAATEFTVFAQTEDGSKTWSSGITLEEKRINRAVKIPVKLDGNVSRLRFEVHTVRDGEPSNVHLWEITLE